MFFMIFLGFLTAGFFVVLQAGTVSAHHAPFYPANGISLASTSAALELEDFPSERCDVGGGVSVGDENIYGVWWCQELVLARIDDGT